MRNPQKVEATATEEQSLPQINMTMKLFQLNTTQENLSMSLGPQGPSRSHQIPHGPVMESTIEKYMIRPPEEIVETNTARTVIYSDVEGGKK